MKIGKKIYYDKTSGEVIISTAELEYGGIKTTIEQDIVDFKTLSERNRDTFDFIQLEFGQYAQDFAECNGYRVNPQTKELEFSYPDPNNPEAPPVYQKPLTEQIADIRTDLKSTQDTLDFLLLG